MKRAAQSLLLAAALSIGATAVMAASDVKKAEHAVSGASHRVSQDYHKQVKDYHLRRARHNARHGNFGKAIAHAEKANSHDVAEHKQGHEARVKEKAVRHD